MSGFEIAVGAQAGGKFGGGGIGCFAIAYHLR
jgi:hypothetical protein